MYWELILCCGSFFRRRVRTRKMTKKTPMKKALVKEKVKTPTTKQRTWTPIKESKKKRTKERATHTCFCMRSSSGIEVDWEDFTRHWSSHYRGSFSTNTGLKSEDISPFTFNFLFIFFSFTLYVVVCVSKCMCVLCGLGFKLGAMDVVITPYLHTYHTLSVKYHFEKVNTCMDW